MNGEHGELYKVIIDMEARLSEKIEHLGERLIDKHNGCRQTMDGRIDKLEQFKSKVKGMVVAVSVISAVVSTVVGLVWRFVLP